MPRRAAPAVAAARAGLFSVAGIAAIGAVALPQQAKVAPGGAAASAALVSDHGCRCTVQKPDFPEPCFDRHSDLTGLAWGEEGVVARPFCAVDFARCAYPAASPDVRPGEGRVLLSCSTEEARRWWAAGGGLVECRDGARSVLGPVGGGAATCAGLATGDECAARGDGTPHAVCAHSGQRCADASAAEGDWACVCAEQQTELAAGRAAAAVCAVDECALRGAAVCAAAGQRCVEASTSPARTGDWSCNCDTARGLVGSRRGAAADCRRVVSAVQTVSGPVTARQASAPSFVSAFERAMQREAGVEATVFEVRQRPAADGAAGATQIEAVLVAAAGDDTAALRRRAAVPARALEELLSAAPGALSTSAEARDVVECGEQEYAQGGRCLRCPPGSENRMGDRADAGDTRCAPLECAANERVALHACVPCGLGLEREAGDEATGDDTQCAAASPAAVARRAQAAGAEALLVDAGAARGADAESILAREASAEQFPNTSPSPPAAPARRMRTLSAGGGAGGGCAELGLPDECVSAEAEVCIAAYVSVGCIGSPDHVPKQCEAIDPSCVGVACAGLPKCMAQDECKWDARLGCVELKAAAPAAAKPALTPDDVCPECGVTVTANRLFMTPPPRRHDDAEAAAQKPAPRAAQQRLRH